MSTTPDKEITMTSATGQAVSTYFNMISEHRSEFLKPGFDLFIPVFYDNQLLV